ncbi:2805_t:CDS:2, partial [Dentiscutata heterogama]
KTYRQIAKLVGCDPKTVRNILNRLENLSQVLLDCQRRPLILDESAQDRLTQLVLNNHHMTKEQIQAALEQREGKVVSQRTISCTLRKANLFAHVARAKPFISDKTKKKASKNVLWSDEKYFSLVSSNPRQYVWRRPDKEFNDDCLVLAIKSKGIMM